MDELENYRKQLRDTELQLLDKPNDEALLALKEGLEELVAAMEADLPTAPPAQTSPPPEPEQPSYMANHPALQPGYRKPGSAPAPVEKAPVVLRQNDIIEAKWMSGDKLWYEAQIDSITGPPDDLRYNIHFTKDPGTETNLRSWQVRPLRAARAAHHTQNEKKRKAETPPPPDVTYIPAPPPATIPTTSFSAAPSVNPAYIKSNATAVADGGTSTAGPQKKAKRGKGSMKQVQENVNKWKAFQATGMTGNKTSMFGLGASPTARVGYSSSSGQSKRQDVSRSRHNYAGGDEE